MFVIGEQKKKRAASAARFFFSLPSKSSGANSNTNPYVSAADDYEERQLPQYRKYDEDWQYLLHAP